MGIIWTKEMIRNELRRLDRITGLKGADLPICWGSGKNLIGVYYIRKEGNFFRFSRHFFRNANWSETDAIDAIRHEYAHYMDHIFNGAKYYSQEAAHGESWKKCCLIVGAQPYRYRSEIKKVQEPAEKAGNNCKKTVAGGNSYEKDC